MTSHSKGAPIYLMDVRVAFKKNKRVLERSMWVVSVFDDVSDLTRFDKSSMFRLKHEIYGKSKANNQIIIREVMNKKFISKSQLTIDEHRKQNNPSM